MRRAGILVSAAALATLAACGVPVTDTAEPIPDLGRAGSASASPTPSPAPTDAPSVVATVWWVDGPRLVPRGASIATPVTESGLLDILAVGPSSGVALRTLNSDPLGGAPLATAADDQASPDPSGLQTVSLSPTFGELSAEDQVLLLGQVVLTLTEIDRSPVQFVDSAGAALSVPLPDGRLRDGPVTRGDYASLT